MAKVVLVSLLAATAVASTARPVLADVILDFEEISVPGDAELLLFSYMNQGFTITATNSATALASGFLAYGQNSVFFMGSQGLAPLAPATGVNVITLSHDSVPFSIASIDLARNFLFDPPPSVTFTGTQVGGTMLSQTFTVTTPLGERAFQSFVFDGFTDLVSLRWEQPPLAQGLHQFDNISVDAVTVPEPAGLVLAGCSMALLALSRASRRRAKARTHSSPDQV
jgi:hypothetical protein